jgi:hypothetical protein
MSLADEVAGLRAQVMVRVTCCAFPTANISSQTASQEEQEQNLAEARRDNVFQPLEVVDDQPSDRDSSVNNACGPSQF